ncbi:MAG: AAA family ATPase, partial [Bacteroidota bacterium]
MIETNPELELAFEYISETKRHVFLTGKAGTGKTTFLNRVREEVPKRLAVVAPTGVAAINAKGVTIHSLFQLPFGLIAPERLDKEIGKKRFSRKKIELIKGLDLLVIDEISMVRADVLDAVDAVLRRFRQSGVPFGGLQLLMIGDLHQLPPVVRPEEWYQMQAHYNTPYFFGSIALRQATPTVIQLKHIYRQSDDVFIALLNKVRNNQMDQACLETLNQRYVPDFKPAEDEGYITLTSHNNAAQLINRERLDQLAGRTYTLGAVVEGDFPESMYPNEEKIALKVGAQVMFNKNDTYPDRMYYNGKIGVITDIFGDHITVECPGEEPINVYPVTWENRKYELNPASKEIEDRVVGTYEQHPLKLAWAITIHKSQGLTFENVIIDAQAAFAHGQVYVALSRCKTFEGIVLRTPIDTGSVRTDHVVQDYSKTAEENHPTAVQLLADKRAYQADCLRELFNFSQVEKAARWFLRSLLEHEKAIQGDDHVTFKALLEQTEEKVFNIGNKFLPWLEIYFREGSLPTAHQKLNERLDGAQSYFTPYLSTTLLPALQAFNAMTDNQSVRKQLDERMHNLRLLVFTKWKLFESLKDGFEPTKFIKVRANAEIDFARNKPAKKTKSKAVPKNIPNQK